ncbi:YraN family protein [Candidatus Gottesmanbacteria bacterium]|nr:YraN family protein [Candidatus Gottesmanbacteria bacterium]
MSLKQNQLGKRGENIAATYLKNHGYRVIERNFKKRYGEIDCIALKDNILIFVEVKTRIGITFGRPEEAVTKRKLQEVIQTGQYYALLHPQLPTSQRVDVIAIILNEDERILSFEHIQNVTG